MTWRGAALALALCAGCASDIARDSAPAPEPQWTELKIAWILDGQPPCPGQELWIYVAADLAEVKRRCQNPAAVACLQLLRVPGTIIRFRHVAVLSEQSWNAWPHEGIHALEDCAWGAYDYKHTGAYWHLQNFDPGPF